MRVPNIDTLSAFIDRLISERIKLYHFETKLDDEKSAQHQRDVVDAIKDKLEQLFVQSMSSDQYEYIDEKRTFGQERIDEVKKLIDNIEELTVNDLDVGAAYYEQQEGNATPQQYMDNELKLREANEKRSKSKNNIDKAYKEAVEIK